MPLIVLGDDDLPTGADPSRFFGLGPAWDAVKANVDDQALWRNLKEATKPKVPWWVWVGALYLLSKNRRRR